MKLKNKNLYFIICFTAGICLTSFSFLKNKEVKSTFASSLSTKRVYFEIDGYVNPDNVYCSFDGSLPGIAKSGSFSRSSVIADNGNITNIGSARDDMPILYFDVPSDSTYLNFNCYAIDQTTQEDRLWISWDHFDSINNNLLLVESNNSLTIEDNLYKISLHHYNGIVTEQYSAPYDVNKSGERWSYYQTSEYSAPLAEYDGWYIDTDFENLYTSKKLNSDIDLYEKADFNNYYCLFESANSFGTVPEGSFPVHVS